MLQEKDQRSAMFPCSFINLNNLVTKLCPIMLHKCSVNIFQLFKSYEWTKDMQTSVIISRPGNLQKKKIQEVAPIPQMVS